MEITQELIYFTIGLGTIASLIVAYILHKKDIHFPFL